MTGPRQALSWIGHRGREALMLPALWRGTGPRIVFLPSTPGPGASDLRAVRIAAELRRQGWHAVALPPQLEAGQRARLIGRFRPDLIVFQQCRHPLNRADLAFGRPFLLDIDDADFHDPRLAPRLETMARGARAVIAGSRYIRDWAQGFCPRAEVVWTGSPISPGPRPPQGARGPLVAWAQADPLGYPAEMAFVETVLRPVAAARPDAVLRLYGVNDAAARAALAARFDFIRLETLPSLPYRRFLLSLRDVAVGLSPILPEAVFSRGKSFGKILGYLDAKVPVICSDQADHALFFTPRSGVVSDDAGAWTATILRLLADPAGRETMAGAAFADFQARLSLPAAAARVGDVLRRAL